VLIVGIGFYPKMATQMYDAKTVAVNAQARQAYAQLAQANPQLSAQKFLTPQSEVLPVLGILK